MESKVGAIIDGTIVSEKLTPHNYRDWAQAMLLAVGGRGKLEILTGETKQPSDSKVDELKQWKIDNAMVSSWLINAMTPQLKKSFMYLPSAYEIWVAVHDSYVDSKDLSHIFDIQRQIWKSSQGSRGVTEYWLELNGLWQELDLLNHEEWKCSTDAANKKKLK